MNTSSITRRPALLAPMLGALALGAAVSLPANASTPPNPGVHNPQISEYLVQQQQDSHFRNATVAEYQMQLQHTTDHH
jgi:hypothetical protein